MRYFIELSYKGTSYNGWQRQPNALAVQQVLEETLEKVLRVPVELVGSSRTDTGVHASQQYAHLDLPAPLPDPDRTVHSLNALLPHDIAVRRLVPVPDEVHSRFAATHRRYEYRMVRHKDPFLTHEAYVYRPELDLDAMNRAADVLLRHEDFESFSKIHTSVNNFRCHLTEARWYWRGEVLVFGVQSNRFLRGMVRALVGTLLKVGRGQLSVEDFERIIVSRNRKEAGAQAPPHGLFLVEVGYPEGLL
jgi:tRNA pseudouridine38-40 synthase